jgi:hypothetical protein
METLTPAETPTSPTESPRDMLLESDELVLPVHKRMVAQYATDPSGTKELRLYYGAREISFDEPELFAFGETLAKQSYFVAGTATSWGAGYEWSRIKALFEQLIDAGVLRRADRYQEIDTATSEGARSSPLPPATCTAPRTWFECESITETLVGRPLEMAWLELVIPIFRVAHMTMDADGRQVGESNVFPKALRIDVPTNWRTCIFPGTRFQTVRPINVTALKTMRAYWPQMMAAVLRIREGYLARFPEARSGWTVGHLERLSTAVLAVPTYQIMRPKQPVENGQLHPALSSLFRVTDGVRMTMHQMLFVPIGEPTLAADAPMTSAEIFAYAERNYSFHSDHGVCAGPKAMIEEFLAALVDGRPPRDTGPVVLDAAVQQALDDLEPALDYALYGLQAYAVVFSFWPVMTRAYENMLEVAEQWAPHGSEAVQSLRDRLHGHIGSIKTSTFLATEKWRMDRDYIYADMYEQCGRGLGAGHVTTPLAQQIAPRRTSTHADVEQKLTEIVRQRFGLPDASDVADVERMVACLMDFFLRAQSILRAACETQSHINRMFERASATRSFGAAEIDIHNLLQGSEARRLPFLVDELEAVMNVSLVIDQDTINISARAGALDRSCETISTRTTARIAEFRAGLLSRRPTLHRQRDRAVHSVLAH